MSICEYSATCRVLSIFLFFLLFLIDFQWNTIFKPYLIIFSPHNSLIWVIYWKMCDVLLSEKFLDVFGEEEVAKDHLVAGHHLRGEHQRHWPADAVHERKRLQSRQSKMFRRLVTINCKKIIKTKKKLNE